MGSNGPPPPVEHIQQPTPWMPLGVILVLVSAIVFALLIHGKESGKQERMARQAVYEQGRRAGEAGVTIEGNPWAGAWGIKRYETIWLDGYIDGAKERQAE